MGEEEEAAQEILAASSLLLEPTTAATRQPTIVPLGKNNPWGSMALPCRGRGMLSGAEMSPGYSWGPAAWHRAMP